MLVGNLEVQVVLVVVEVQVVSPVVAVVDGQVGGVVAQQVHQVESERRFGKGFA